MYDVDRTQSYVMFKQVIDITTTSFSRVNPAGLLGIVDNCFQDLCLAGNVSLKT
jgi:hypothetical protein